MGRRGMSFKAALFSLTTLAALVAASCSTRRAQPQPLQVSNSQPLQVSNPVIPGDYPDPSVIRVGEEWRLLNGEATIGAYPTFDAASDVADKLCRAAANVGHQVDLTVQTMVGELRKQSVPGRAR